MSELPTGTVTLLFSDIEGSTRLLQRTGNAYAELLAEHRRLLTAAFGRHGGTVVDSEGDAFFVAFPSAVEAVAAAAEAQQALAGHDWPGDDEIRVRMGLHTGEPRAIDGNYVGLDVHHAARVMAAGHGGQVLVSETTRALLDERFQLRDLGEHRLKDLSGPQRLYQLRIEGRPSEFPPLKTLDNRPTNLPVLANALVGRGRELEEAESILAAPDVRLLTLTGAGGAGKTRLALQLAANVVDSFPNGVFFVSLAPIRDWELVIPTIAQTVGLREQRGEPIAETLTEYVRDKRVLLVLDNFEHVLPAAPAIAGILASAPGPKVLATSRTPLRLSGERAYLVPPLPVDDAVQLFVERARAAAASFELSDESGSAVVEICSRLDGLPLAIELAAPRVRSLPPAALLARLDRTLKLLTGGAQDLDERQRTLRATIEWSYELLTDDERKLFTSLGVFVGGCRLEAAEALAPELRTDVLDGLDSLVEKSLLRQRPDSDGEPRFWMLETIREFALELLEDEGGLVEISRRHAEYFASLAETLDLEARTGEHAAILARLDDDNANLRAALDFARETGDDELMVRLATALWGFWATRGYVAEGLEELEEALARSDERPARALLGLCTLRLLSSYTESMSSDAREALEACKQLGDDYSLAQAWNLVGRVDSFGGTMTRGEDAWREALAYAEQGGYMSELAESVAWLLIAALYGPRPAEEGIALCKEFADRYGADATIRAWCQVERSALEAMRGRPDLGRQLLAEGARTLREHGLSLYAANTAQERYFVETLGGDPQAAARALRDAYAVLERMGERGFLSTIAGLLAQALVELGDYDEAEEFSRASDEAAAPDDVFSQVLWRTALAKVRARQGELARAEQLAREAVELIEQTDLLTGQAYALLDLADVLELAGLREEALAAAEDAARRFEQKGNLPALERATAVAAALAA